MIRFDEQQFGSERYSIMALSMQDVSGDTSCCDQPPSEISKAIAAASVKSWDTIDLKHIQVILGRRLADSDIQWVLLCINAVNKTRSLKLTDCLSVSGAGLDPLQGSTVLESIDLSLVGVHKSPTIEPEPYISTADVVPILKIGAEGNQLFRIQFPKKWLVERGDELTPLGH